jgi:DNA-binding transcriptional MerR regulator
MPNVILASIKDSAQMLGVSVRSIHRYCSLGILPHLRVGRRKMLRTADLLKFAEVGVSVATLNRVREAMRQGRRP